MELFTRLFGSWLVFVHHCFDRIVLSGYLMGLQRPGQVVYWLQQVLGVEAITKEVLSRRTQDYIGWVEAYACNQKIPLKWTEKELRKEDYVRPYLRPMERQVYHFSAFIQIGFYASEPFATIAAYRLDGFNGNSGDLALSRAAIAIGRELRSLSITARDVNSRIWKLCK